MTDISSHDFMQDAILESNSLAKRPLLVGLIFGITLTFILFFCMQALTAFNDEVDLSEGPTLRFVDVIEDIPEEVPAIKERIVEKPNEIVPPPETPEVEVLETDSNPNVLGLGNSAPKATLTGIGLTGLNMGAYEDGDYLPLVRVQPQFPRRAAIQGVTGSVLVSLTVNEDGTVPKDSIQILRAEPKGYFERESISAASKFKYKPKIVNGTPQVVTGVKYLFVFELPDAGSGRASRSTSRSRGSD